MADDDDEGGFGGLYEDGHWAWDENTRGLIFVRFVIFTFLFTFTRLRLFGEEKLRLGYNQKFLVKT